jgi:transcriptional regulator with XRE-family HTH domain
MIAPEQSRAARGMLGWGQKTLAARASVGIVTVRQFEAGAQRPQRATLHVIQRAFEDAGINFIDADGEHGPGVRCASLRDNVSAKSKNGNGTAERRTPDQLLRELVAYVEAPVGCPFVLAEWNDTPNWSVGCGKLETSKMGRYYEKVALLRASDPNVDWSSVGPPNGGHRMVWR